MAELIVRSRMRSSMRRWSEFLLNAGFPLWGLILPVVSMCMFVSIVAEQVRGYTHTGLSMLGFATLSISFSMFCLLLKRALSNDFLVVDKHGIQLPRCMGSSFNLLTYLPWQNVQTVKGIVNRKKAGDSKIAIHRKRGRPIYLSVDHLESHTAEQVILSARMWTPQLCDASLDELQEAIRALKNQGNETSYTELWEEEMSRRFCPAAYIALEPGKVLRGNSLKIISHLASGGLSALYLCQLDNQKLVVLKEAVAPEECIESVREKAKELFEREARLLLKLDHPAIVRVLDWFTESDRNYILLEHISGVDLRQLVKQHGAQKESDVLEWAIQIANGLKYLHEQETPVIHRDLTPDNIVLKSDGKLVIVDFGAANEFIGNATGTFVGKHSYIAPEQLRGKASPLSDIYAFGCTLHYLLTGEEPEALSPSAPKTINPSISDELSELIESCTQLEPGDRYQSATQLLPVLRRLAAQTVVL